MASLDLVLIPNGSFAENCYLVFDPEQADTVLVDPGEETARFLAEAKRRDRQITAIWLTHAHLDHIHGVGAIRSATRAPIWLHPDDRPLYDAVTQQAGWLGVSVATLPPPDHPLTHGDRLRIGGVEVEVRHVPGHTPGHVCFVIPGAVLAGDVLFQGSIGRTDLPGGDHETLLASIRRELFSLPDDTVVYPGHGPPTTIGQERATNPFLT